MTHLTFFKSLHSTAKSGLPCDDGILPTSMSRRAPVSSFLVLVLEGRVFYPLWRFACKHCVAFARMVEWLSMAERGEANEEARGRERARQRQVERKKRARRKSKQVAFMILSPSPSPSPSLAFFPFGERERERFRSLSNQPFESVAFRGDIGDIALGEEMKSTFK